ncbi:hypothetical protein TKK_0008249 [Trichogramma kaykai]
MLTRAAAAATANRGVKRPSESDDKLARLISDMRAAYSKDLSLVDKCQPATCVQAMLPRLISELPTSQDDLHSALEHDFLSVLRDWISPFPDGSLPGSTIRESVLELLREYDQHYEIDRYYLKRSRIGQAVAILYTRKEETEENKSRAKVLIYQWAAQFYDHFRKQLMQQRKNSSVREWCEELINAQETSIS